MPSESKKRVCYFYDGKQVSYLRLFEYTNLVLTPLY